MTNWQTKTIQEITTLIKDGTHGTHKDVKNGIPLLSAKDISAGKVNVAPDSRVISEADFNAIHARYSLKDGDILLTIVGSLGRVAIVTSYANNYTFQRSVAILRFNNEVDTSYTYYYLTSSIFQKELLKRESKGAQGGVYLGDISKIKIHIPEKPEQERIVGVLEVWDEYIEKLEQKIALKEQLKKGLMQQLLTGKRRLLGFNGEWHEVKLNDLVSITTGRKDVNQGNPDGEYPFFTCSRRHTYSDEYSFDDEAILIAGNGDVGHCKYYKGKFEAYQRTYVLTGFDKVSAQYIFPFLQHYFQNFSDAQKQMGAMPFIKVGMLKDFNVVLPIDKDEQESIAGLVADANDEISFLTDKMKAIKLQKKYLLKNLITGTIRTPEDLQPLDSSRLERSAL